jgi:hypothetical protein
LAALFFCGPVELELRVGFAISFHHAGAVAAGCYNRCVLYRQACFWNTCTTYLRQAVRHRECPDPMHAVPVARVQTLAQSIARTTLPLSSHLL